MQNKINSTIKGKAYGFACVVSFEKVISAIRPTEIENNESLRIAKLRFEQDITDKERTEMLKSAKAGVLTIIKMEPKIVEDGTDKLIISLQPDSAATLLGDIRDVLIIRRSIEWEIGISVKHNHAALKHSMLSAHLDFWKRWFGINCSETYFKTIKPIFERLSQLKRDRVPWGELTDKDTSVYMSILNAFRIEFERLNKQHGSITENLVRYLLWSNGKDYYKLIHNKNRTTTIMPFNLFGTLKQKREAITRK